MIVGDRVRVLRERRILSLAELAERAGLSVASLSSVEKSEAVPSLVVLERLASALGVALHELFYEGEPPDLPNLPDRQTGDDIVKGKRRKDRK